MRDDTSIQILRWEKKHTVLFLVRSPLVPVKLVEKDFEESCFDDELLCLLKSCQYILPSPQKELPPRLQILPELEVKKKNKKKRYQ